MPVSRLVTVTVTPGSTPPELSETTPSMAPLAACDCANAGAVSISSDSTAEERARNMLEDSLIDSEKPEVYNSKTNEPQPRTQNDVLPVKTDRFVGGIQFFGAMSLQNATGEVSGRRTVTGVAKGEQVVRVIAMRADVRQAVGRARVVGGPAERRLQAGDIRIQSGEFVHQLAGPLDDDLVAKARRRFVAISPAHQDLFVADPADRLNNIGRRGHVADDRGAGSQERPRLRRHALAQDEVARAKPEVPPQRLEERRGHAGGDDDVRRANRSAGGEHVGGLAVEADAPPGRSLEQQRPALLRGGRKAEARAIGIDRRALLASQTASRVDGDVGVDRARVHHRR